MTPHKAMNTMKKKGGLSKIPPGLAPKDKPERSTPRCAMQVSRSPAPSS
ncbi:hypothetical protein PoMZ_09883 [Pyricularia oryzae]|uniref:Uncharacterized protein n=1 Tax=Pyricularia oryzae TaxID=318829 RepID=A0A4P7MVW5_PYROR|nr:hypothetical protein PoMZ_09883 [Pyricularia oryzae]